MIAGMNWRLRISAEQTATDILGRDEAQSLPKQGYGNLSFVYYFSFCNESYLSTTFQSILQWKLFVYFFSVSLQWKFFVYYFSFCNESYLSTTLLSLFAMKVICQLLFSLFLQWMLFVYYSFQSILGNIFL